jgi:hypothetical protein
VENLAEHVLQIGLTAASISLGQLMHLPVKISRFENDPSQILGDRNHVARNNFKLAIVEMLYIPR